MMPWRNFFIILAPLLLACDHFSQGKPLNEDEQLKLINQLIFTAIDQDQNGGISFDEFLKAFFKGYNCHQFKSAGPLRDKFVQTDLDKDNKLTMKEALAPTGVMFNLKIMNTTEVEKRFKAIDINNDGSLSFGEIAFIVAFKFAEDAEPELRTYFQQMDKDKNGEWLLDELVAYEAWKKIDKRTLLSHLADLYSCMEKK